MKRATAILSLSALPLLSGPAHAGDATKEPSQAVKNAVERLTVQRMRYTKDLFADQEIKTGPEESESVRAAIESAVKKDAGEHAGWGKTTPAPADAEAAALAALKAQYDISPVLGKLKFLGVRVVEKDWLIEQNRFGQPTAQWKHIRVIAKRDGLEGCIAFYGTINHAHMGGGKYAPRWGSVANTQWSGVKCPTGK